MSMKISGNGRVSTPAARKTGAKPGVGGGFSVTDTGPAGPAESTAGVGNAGPVASVDALLAIQEVSGDRQGRRQAVRRGKDMLEVLDDIRLGLLTGGVPRARLEQLVRMVEERHDTFTDPGLSAILDEIELRARVELAKLGFPAK